MELVSLEDLFKGRVIKVPDYQRGYSWIVGEGEPVNQFWDDLDFLRDGAVHYTGMITLNEVGEEVWRNDSWLQEKDLIAGEEKMKPYHLVDGQQRLTTSIILVQCIIEELQERGDKYRDLVCQLRENIIVKRDSSNIPVGYLFSYERDDPSDEYMKNKILGIQSSYGGRESVYTRNLKKAKSFFQLKLKEMTSEEIIDCKNKITKQFKYNLFVLDSSINVNLAFETMNNRGKPLSNLELLKNRLVYLSTIIKGAEGCEVLRREINNVWKTVYEYLGKNPNGKLNDNEFLRDHWIMYYKYSKRRGGAYIDALLNDTYSPKRLTHEKSNKKELTEKEISRYVLSIQKGVKYWFHMKNPYFDPSNGLTEMQKKWLEKMSRLGFRSVTPLILSAFLSSSRDGKKRAIEDLLRAAERYVFVVFKVSNRRASTGQSDFFRLAHQLKNGELSIEGATDEIHHKTSYFYSETRFLATIEDCYRHRKGFYSWDGLRYLLFEYDQYLKEKGKQSDGKLTWHGLAESKSDKVTVEHIFPVTHSNEYWQSRFDSLSNKSRSYLTHSLGNLIPLSRSKNSSLQNDSFDKKCNRGNGVGYFNGCASENVIASYDEWTPREIIDRGMILLRFIEKRWNITLGDNDFKYKLLHIDNSILEYIK